MTRGRQGLAQQIIASLMPSRREIVYEILRDEIHADVSDWANYKKGATAPAANPKYCYEWCFTQGDQHVVLNLWHASFQPDGDDVICELNMRAYANEIARAKDEPWRDKKPKPVWEKRARNMDLAIQRAVRNARQVRVIVCEGNMRDIAAGDEKASEVKRRMLDPSPWNIDSYDWTTGETVLRRDTDARGQGEGSGDTSVPVPAPDTPISAEAFTPLPPPNSAAATPEGGTANPGEPAYVDQFDTNLGGVPERRDISSGAFVRSPDVRAAALRRAGGRCQLCGQPGFMTVAGKVYLETHHVQPLGEGGLDVLTNVVALCATDHRRAHFASQRSTLGEELRRIAEGVSKE